MHPSCSCSDNKTYPRKGQRVTVHYTGTLVRSSEQCGARARCVLTCVGHTQMNGDKFDSSRERNQPFSFRIGSGEVIRGWDDGISRMRLGQRCARAPPRRSHRRARRVRAGPASSSRPTSHVGPPVRTRASLGLPGTPALTCASCADGSRTLPRIPGNSTLAFDVELLKIED